MVNLVVDGFFILVLLFLYLVFGSFVFSTIEGSHFVKEGESRRNDLVKMIKKVAENTNLEENKVMQILHDLSKSENSDISMSVLEIQKTENDTYKVDIAHQKSEWDMLESFFFVVTVITTIGYFEVKSDKL